MLIGLTDPLKRSFKIKFEYVKNTKYLSYNTWFNSGTWIYMKDQVNGFLVPKKNFIIHIFQKIGSKSERSLLNPKLNRLANV